MRRFFSFAPSVFAAMLFAGGASAAEIIHRYDQLVRVAKDGTLTVTETIRVRAEGREIKRGIYREFPLYFEGPDKKLREVTFKVLSVMRDGKPEPYFTRKQGKNIRIYAGEEKTFLPTGDYSYQFTYETGRQIRWFDGKPELYWNVTGNAWNFPILRATVRVELPGISPERWTAFTGRYGEQGKDWRGQVNADNSLYVETTRPLPPGQGFTIAATYPQGAINPPTQAQNLWYNFLDYRNWILAAGGFVLVFGYYLWAWNAVGRDPQGGGTIIPLFYPPKNLSPALSNYVHNWGFGGSPWRAFTAAALSLAVKGLVLFDDNKGQIFTLKATGKEPDGGVDKLPPGERAIFKWVKSEGGNARITRENGIAVRNAGNDFREAIEGEGHNKFFRRNLGYSLAGIALTIVTVVAVVMFGGLQEADLGLLIFMLFISVFLGMFVIPLLRALFGALSGSGEIKRALQAMLVLGFVGVVGFMMLSSVWSSNIEILPAILHGVAQFPFPFVLVCGFATLNGLFLYLMKAPTVVGKPLMDQLAGFKMYLETAESPRLNTGAPQITAERFEQILPYAVALDVEKPWANAFASALAKAHPGDDNPMQHYHPRWSSNRNWSPDNFGNTIGSTVSAATSAFVSAVPPTKSSSSGFSSGGGSGGGGGGGGGGGW